MQDRLDTLAMSQPAPHGGAALDHIDIVAWVLRFLKSARLRKKTLLACMTVSLALGAARYATSPKAYESHAEVMVLEQGGRLLDRDVGQTRVLADLMPNYERVFTSDRVLQRAIQDLPVDFRGDFLGLQGDRWLDAFRARLSVTTLRRTNIIQVSYRSADPETAYEVVQTLVSASLEFLNTMHSDSASDGLRILQDEMTRRERMLEAKQFRLRQLMRDSGVLFQSEQGVENVSTDKLMRLGENVAKAQQAAIEAKALQEEIERAVVNGLDIGSYASQLNEGLGTKLLEKAGGFSTQDSLLLGKLEQQLVDDQAKLNSMLGTLGPRHPDVIAMHQKIEQAQGYIAARQETSSDVARAQSQQILAPQLLEISRDRANFTARHFAALKRQYEVESEEASRINDQAVEVGFLNGEVRRLETSLNELRESIRDLDLGKQAGIRAKVITDARINRRPVSPRASLIALVALVLGAGSGLAAVYVLDLLDDRFRSPDDLRIQLGAPILAMVRKLPPLADNGVASLYPFARPTAVESEAFRSLRTSLDFSGQETRRLTISSTEPGDGKTTVMASLAVAFAQAGKRTLAIDGDLRRPGLTKLLKLSHRPGLSTLLKSSAPLEALAEAVVHSTEVPGLFVIPAGPRTTNPGELLSSERLSEIIEWADGAFDQVLIDAPPSLAVSDVQLIGRVVDGALLTVRPDRNHRKMVIRAAESLSALGCPLIGIVVNQLQPRSGGEYSYGYGYGYGYGYHDDAPDPHPAADAPHSQAA